MLYCKHFLLTWNSYFTELFAIIACLYYKPQQKILLTFLRIPYFLLLAEILCFQRRAQCTVSNNFANKWSENGTPQWIEHCKLSRNFKENIFDLGSWNFNSLRHRNEFLKLRFCRACFCILFVLRCKSFLLSFCKVTSLP